MGNNSGNMPILHFMSTFVVILLKSVSSKTTYAQATNSSDSFNTSKQLLYSPESSSPDNFNMIKHSVRKETLYKSLDATMDYTDTTESISYNDNFDYGDEYMYSGYSFERPMYLYIWEILVIFTFLLNTIVVSVFLQKKMRSATNLILTAIAISDTLTGLVTLPTYIMVYQNYDQLPDSDYGYDFGNSTINESTILPSYPATNDMLSNEDQGISTSSFGKQNNTSSVSSNPMFDGITENPYYDLNATQSPIDWYILPKDLCRGFMISKYFLSKSFHTMSIFLTLLLGIQRYVSAAYLFKAKFFNVKNTIIFCVFIFLISPVLHTYHLATDKAEGGLCQWTLGEEGCGADCVYLWVLFFIRHFIPCVSLTTFTILFIKRLRSKSSKSEKKNRRILMAVTAIVIVFLVTEIPYGSFLLYGAIEKTVNNGKNFHLKTNRTIHMAYEIFLVLSFNANVIIYLLLYKKFRVCLYETYVKPMRRLVRGTRNFSVSSTSTTFKRATKMTDSGTSQGALELKAMQTTSSDRSVTMETKLKQSFSQDTSKSCSNIDSNELSGLNANI